MAKRDPFEEGKLAAFQKQDASTCPYPSDSDGYDKWRAGYDFVKGSDDEGEPLDDA